MSRVRRALAGPLLLAIVGLPLPAAATAVDAPALPLAPRGADEAARRRAEAEMAAAAAALAEAQAVESRAHRRVPEAEKAVKHAEARVALTSAEEQLAAEQLAGARRRLRQFAVAHYVNGGSSARAVDHLLGSRDHLDMVRRSSIISTATDVQRDAVAAHSTAQARASEQLEADIRAVEEALLALARASVEARAATVRRGAAAKEAENRRLLLDLVTAAAPVVPSDIPRLFLDAYRRTATVLQKKAPGCRLSWTAIAAIGKIETNHGRYRSAQLALNGDVVPRIIGLKLDGTNRTRLIKDTDQGELDGDVDFDRAVGPMQFIPSTWKRMAQDGNGDGVADPNNAYDSAMGTGTYLCRATRGAPVDVEEGLRTAFFSYNRSEAYVDSALSWMATYEAMANQLPPPSPPPAAPKSRKK